MKEDKTTNQDSPIEHLHALLSSIPNKLVITDSKGIKHEIEKDDEIFIDTKTLEVTVVKPKNQYQSKYLGVINSMPQESYFNRAMQKIQEMHDKKAKDYTSESREFGNFEDSAKHAGITVAQSIESLIGTKEARRQNIEHNNLVPLNESLEDTLYDRAVYAVIRYAHYLSGKD